MEQLNKVLGEYQTIVDGAEQRIAKERELLAIEKNAKRQFLENKRFEIKAGKDTTGSELHDGLITVYGQRLIDNPEILENYESVQKQLIGKRGQPIVMIKRQVESRGCSGFGGELQKSLDTYVVVGVLGGTKLKFDYDEETVSLPTSKHSYLRKVSFSTSVPYFTRGPLFVSGGLRSTSLLNPDIDLGYSLDSEIKDRDISSRVSFGDGKIKKMELLIGHEGIRDWLLQDTNDVLGILREIRENCDVLSIPPIEPATDYQRHYIEDMLVK